MSVVKNQIAYQNHKWWLVFGRGVRHRQGASEVTIFDPSERVECIATQLLHYDRYSGCQYFLERVDVNGKYGLACEEVLDGCGTHSKILLQPIYNEIRVCKISSKKAIYDKYAVFANGNRIGDFTLVLNAWVPRVPLEKQHN
ncbi:MAG: hypothetical protein ACXW4Q_10470 [Anaerolineales bacterium]